MLDIQMQVGFTRPVEQMKLIEKPTDSDESNSGKIVSKLEQREQRAIEEGRLPANPTYTVLNASKIYEQAQNVSEKFGRLVAANTYGDPSEVTIYVQQIADTLLDIYHKMNFAGPLEQVQITGSTAPDIQELRQSATGLNAISPPAPPPISELQSGSTTSSSTNDDNSDDNNSASSDSGSTSSSSHSSSHSRCQNGYHRSPSGDCERVTDTRGMPRCHNGYHRSPSGICERVR